MLSICFQNNTFHRADAIVVQHLLQIRHFLIQITGDDNRFSAIFHVGDQLICFFFAEIILRRKKHDTVCIIRHTLFRKKVQLFHLNVFFFNGRFHILCHIAFFMTGNGIHDRQRIRSYIGNRTCYLTLTVKTCGLILIGLIIDGRFKHIGIGNDLVSFLTDNNKRVVFQIVLRIFRNKIRVKHRIHGFHFDVRRKSRIAFQELLDRLIFLSALHDLINGYILIQSTY